MEYIDTSFCDSLITHPNFGSFQSTWSCGEIDLLNLTASDDDEFNQARPDNYRYGVSHTRPIAVSRQSSSTPDHVHADNSIEVPLNGKRMFKSHPDGSVVKRRRGPNKNQKVLTEEERKKKKAKALCRNAESARNCRGKRKQAEERLKTKSLNMERDFHMLCRTREELGQELFDLFEQARNTKDPHIIKAVEQSTLRLSSSLTHGLTMQDLLDMKSQKIPLEPIFTSGISSDSSVLQSTPKPVYIPVAVTQSPPTTVQQLNANDTTAHNYNCEIARTGSNLIKPHLQLDLSKSRKVPSKNYSPQNDSRISNIATPVSIRKMSLAQDEEAVAVQHRLSGSPNPFMGDTMPQEELESTNLMGMISEKSLSFLESQLNSEQEKVNYTYPPSPLLLYNELPSTPFDCQLLMQPTPPSLDASNFNQQIFDLTFSQPFTCHTPLGPLGLTSEDCAPSDLECAIAQLVNFT